MKAVASSDNNSMTACARSRNPCSMPSNASKKATASSTTSAPTTRAMVRSTRWVAAPTARRYDDVGMISKRKMRLSSSFVSRRGASRKSRALRVGGVSITIRSNCPVACSSCSFSIAMYSCVPDSAPDTFRYSEFATIRSACSGDDAYLTTSASKVDLVSSMSAHSSPGQSPLTSRGSLVSSPSPRASARRRAGSMVTTHARRPSCAACTASAAALVVLPTPPDPQHTTTLLCAARSAIVVMPAPRAVPRHAPASLQRVGLFRPSRSQR